MSYTDYDFPHSRMYDSDLRELIKQIEELWKNVNAINEWEAEHKEQYEELKNFMDAIVSGNFPPGFSETLTNWLDQNAFDIIGSMVKHVYFGIDDRGYSKVTIPEQWKDLIFKTTGFDFNTPLQTEYGHLCLFY